MNNWVILPVKPLTQSKTRLAALLSPTERAALTQHLLEQTLQVLQQLPAITTILVVSHDKTVLATAEHYQAQPFTEKPPYGLKTAVSQAAKYATLQQQADSILIIPADLPFLQAFELQTLLDKAVAAKTNIICPDENQTGTNALLLPPTTTFNFQYGSNSYSNHLSEAKRLNLPIQTITSPGICFDLDTEADWHIYQQTLGVNP